MIFLVPGPLSRNSGTNVSAKVHLYQVPVMEFVCPTRETHKKNAIIVKILKYAYFIILKLISL